MVLPSYVCTNGTTKESRMRHGGVLPVCQRHHRCGLTTVCSVRSVRVTHGTHGIYYSTQLGMCGRQLSNSSEFELIISDISHGVRHRKKLTCLTKVQGCNVHTPHMPPPGMDDDTPPTGESADEGRGTDGILSPIRASQSAYGHDTIGCASRMTWGLSAARGHAMICESAASPGVLNLQRLLQLVQTKSIVNLFITVTRDRSDRNGVN